MLWIYYYQAPVPAILQQSAEREDKVTAEKWQKYLVMTVESVGGQVKGKLQRWSNHVLLALKLMQSMHVQNLDYMGEKCKWE